MQRRTLAALAAATLLGLCAGAAVAQTYPDRPIRMIVPYATGGGTDTVTRIVMKKLSEQLGQPIIVENKPGAGGALAYTEVTRAKPDGYTLTVGSAQVALMALIYDKLAFDPATDIVSVAPMANVPVALVAGSGAPYKTMADYEAAIRELVAQGLVACANILPPMTSEFLTIFKNSSTALTIGVLELTAQSRQISEYTFKTFEAFTAATLIYIVITMTVILLMRAIEKRVAVPGFIAQGGGH